MTAEKTSLHEFDDAKFFEGCLPIEVMAGRGVDTLRFGPMKPVGLTDPRTGREPYACVQLRQDNLAGDHFSLVGFQTQMKWGEQARVLRLIPGLENAEFVRFGMIHRNTYINGPDVLRETWQTQDARRSVLRRPDFRRRGLRRVGGLGPDGRTERRGARARSAAPRAAAHDRARRAGPLRVARQSTPLPADEHHVRDHGADRRSLDAADARGRWTQDEPEGDAQARALRAGACRSRTVDRGRGRTGQHPTSSPQVPDERRARDFLEHLRLNENASQHTVRAYESDLSQFLMFLAARAGRTRAQLTVADVDHLSIREFLADLHRRGNTRSSAARKLAAIRTFSRYLRREGILEGDPAALVGTPKREQRLPAHLGEAEMSALLDMPDGRSRSAAAIAPSSSSSTRRGFA